MLIAQITDTHIVEKNKHWLSEPVTQTRERLVRVVSYLNELKSKPDIVLLTGDASDTGTKESYEHLREILRPLTMPLYIIPGNHDCREGMRRAFSTQAYMPTEGFIQYVLNDYPIRFIGLDTHILGKAGGELCQKRLEWLKETLNIEKRKPTIIFMHHPPAKTGNKIFDAINCLIPPQFEYLITSQDNLIGILTGHYHHLCVTQYNTKLCFMAPSVSPNHYFTNPQEDDNITALELEDPAIALHQYNGNNLISHVIYLRDKISRIDWSSIKNNCT